MKKTNKNRESRAWMSILAVMVMSIAITVPAQSQDLGKALSGCASIVENDARLTCFDAVAALMVDGHGAEDVVAPAAVAAASAVVSTAPAVASAAPATGPLPLTDEVGKERIEPIEADEREKYFSRVVACQESAQSGQYYFTLDNGQVWKQSNYRRLGFRDCAFDIELSKGSLGYQMYIPSKDRSIRVGRVK
jgi:hypothetical protein